MPEIRTSADLRDRYDEISALCRERPEPVFITEGGKDDLAVMSREVYGQLKLYGELYELIQEDVNNIHDGDARTPAEVIRNARGRLFARALKEFQDSMAGEAKKAGINTEEDAVRLVKEVRAEMAAEEAAKEADAGA